MKTRERIKKLITLNWRPKLVCLLAAIIVWLWVEWFYVRDENTEWDMDNIQLSIPE
ncbi:MAG: hypothetical protein IJB31_07065 [Akkermansia sp.]|nr:hypothetical protein [Akkermansia sp.]